MLLWKGATALVDIAGLQQALGVSFKQPSVLEQALVHSSYLNESPALAAASNERLEFLGDAVLGFIIAEGLWQDFPHLSEGEMTQLRSSLVCRECLARMATAIGLGDYLFLGKGEEASAGRRKPTNLAAALEAVIAAIYLDQGLATTRGFILRLFGTELEKVISQGGAAEYKSKLQELTQARWQLTPAYHVVEAVGPSHDRIFTVEVRVDDTLLGKGSGKSKRAAETEAARSALLGFTP
ncbi:ribonuclease III [Chloroflexota bacterium]